MHGPPGGRSLPGTGHFYAGGGMVSRPPFPIVGSGNKPFPDGVFPVAMPFCGFVPFEDLESENILPKVFVYPSCSSCSKRGAELNAKTTKGTPSSQRNRDVRRPRGCGGRNILSKKSLRSLCALRALRVQNGGAELNAKTTKGTPSSQRNRTTRCKAHAVMKQTAPGRRVKGPPA